MMRKAEIAKYGYSVMLLGFGIALILTAWPQLKASLTYLPVEAALNDVQRQKDLDTVKLTALIAKARQSIGLSPQPRYWADLSTLLFLQAQKSPLPEQSLLLTQARESIKQALTASPADSWLWFQLAKFDVLLNQVSKKTLKALTLSIMTGQYEYGHLLPRLQLCLFLLSQFEPQDYALLQTQILIAWEKEPKRFIKEIALKNQHLTKIRLLLQNKSPEVLKAMEAEIEKAH